MNYSDNINALSRTKVDLIKLKMPHCNHIYGEAPCTASGVVKCYNTFPTCQDRENFADRGKTYKFINESLPLSVINQIDFAFPYIADKGINDLATEIKEDDTVVKRLKVKMFDESDNEIGVDPYADERAPAGQFWKKFIQRHKNYRGRTIEHYQGFDGLSEDQYQLKFAGVLDNIEYRGAAQLEAVDFLKELSKKKYPLQLDVRVKNDVGKLHYASSQAAMLALEAYTGDYCRRTDFDTISGLSLVALIEPGAALQDNRTYQVTVVAYDQYDRAIAKSSSSVNLPLEYNALEVDWTDFSGASYYRVFIKHNGVSYYVYFQVTASYYLAVDLGTGIEAVRPTEAERYFQLTGDDPSDINDWTLVSGTSFSFAIEGSQIDEMPASGYVRIDKEIIYYDEIFIGEDGVYYLGGIIRGQFGSESEWHYPYTAIAILYFVTTPTNPFIVLRTLLNLAGISDDYISDTFTDYENEWASNSATPNVTLQPIIKDTKFSRLYFDLVRLTNCMSWVNEDGKIDVLNWNYEPGLQEITDDDIVRDSCSVDFNDESRLTRWIFYWLRTDPDESIDDAKAYRRANVTVDADAESGNEYNDIKEDVQYCVWLNEDSGDEEDISTYINSLLASRKNRTRDPQEVVNLELELKDDAITTGNVVKLTTNYLQDFYGQPYNQVKFRVMKKEISGPNKFKLKLMRKF